MRTGGSPASQPPQHADERAGGGRTQAEDTRLLAHMVLGSVGAFDRLFLRHGGGVRAFGVSMLHSPDAADDLVQETFMQVWRHRDRYSPERASVRAWIFGIARYRAIDLTRTQARHDRLAEAARGDAHLAPAVPDALTETVARDEAVRLRAALADLPTAQRRTLVLAYGGGLSHRELAHRTGVPLGTVKGRLRMGKQGVAQRLDPERRSASGPAA